MSRPPSSGSDVCLYIIAIFLSPLAVIMKVGCGADFWINLCLFSALSLFALLLAAYIAVLGWIPGVIHAWWIISKHETPARGTAHYGGGQPVYTNTGPRYDKVN